MCINEEGEGAVSTDTRQLFELQLLTGDAAGLIKRFMPNLMWSAYRLSIKKQFDSGRLSQEETVLVNRGLSSLEYLYDELRKEVERLLPLFNREELSELRNSCMTRVRFSRCYRIRTPPENSVCRCFQLFDRIILIYSFFWINGLYPELNPGECGRRWHNRFINTCAQICAARRKLESYADAGS